MKDSKLFEEFKERDKDFWGGVKAAKKVYLSAVFNKFDEYSCIKDDKWYLEYKGEMLE